MTINYSSEGRFASNHRQSSHHGHRTKSERQVSSTYFRTADSGKPFWRDQLEPEGSGVSKEPPRTLHTFTPPARSGTILRAVIPRQQLWDCRTEVQVQGGRCPGGVAMSGGFLEDEAGPAGPIEYIRAQRPIEVSSFKISVATVIASAVHSK